MGLMFSFEGLGLKLDDWTLSWVVRILRPRSLPAGGSQDDEKPHSSRHTLFTLTTPHKTLNPIRQPPNPNPKPIEILNLEQQDKVLLIEGVEIQRLDQLVGKIHGAILRAGRGYPRQVNVKPVRVKIGSTWTTSLKGMASPQISQPLDRDGPKARNRSNSVTSVRSDVAAISVTNLPKPGKAWGPGIYGNWTYHQVLEGASRFDTQYAADASNPIRSLDQLYSQATLLRPSLQSFILHLALRHKGMLPKKVKNMP